MPPWLLTVEGELGITLLLWQAGHPLAPGSPLFWVLVWAYLLLILRTWDMLALCSFPAPLWHHCLLIFFFFCFVFNGSEKRLCMILFSLQSSFCKSLLAKELWAWVAWVGGVRWCNQLPSRSSPTVNYPLCVCHLCPDSPSPWLRSNMFLPLSLFHCNVLNTSLLPSDR